MDNGLWATLGDKLETAFHTSIDVTESMLKYQGRAVVNMTRNITIGHEYEIRPDDLPKAWSQSDREFIAESANRHISTYSPSPEALTASVRNSIDLISENGGTIGAVVGLAGIIAPAVAIGECIGSTAGSAFEDAINVGFPIPRKRTRDLLLADLQEAARLDIPVEDIKEDIGRNHRWIGNGRYRGHDSHSLIQSSFLGNDHSIPRHEGHPNELLHRSSNVYSVIGNEMGWFPSVDITLGNSWNYLCDDAFEPRAPY